MREKVHKPARAGAAGRSMVRKQLLITPEQNDRLRALSAGLSRAESELVREALDDWLRKQEAQGEDWKAALREVRGMWKDRTDHHEFYAERRRRRRERRERTNMRMAEARSK